MERIGRIYGYLRISSKDQSELRQRVALKEMGVEDDMIFADQMSGKNFERSDYILLKRVIRGGDTLIVKELDRFGRNKNEIKKELEWFKERGVRVKILDVPTTLIELDGQQWIMEMVNNLLIEVLGTFAEEERLKIRRTQAEGIAAAKAEGKHLGRRKQEVDSDLFEELYKQWRENNITAKRFMEELNLKSNTFYRRIKERKVEEFRARFKETSKKQLAKLLREMEEEFKIPGLDNEKYNQQNPEVIKLYKEVYDACEL
jgi:DNA invertase Pin-like site-specific DNA recombinase